MAKLSRIQSGSTTIATTALSQAATLLAYDVTKSVLIATVRGGNSSPSGSLVLASFPSTTSIQFERNTGATETVTIDWWLLEFASGVSVQHVTFTANGSTTISAVTLAQSFIVSGGFDNGGTLQTDDDVYRFAFASSTSVEHLANSGTVDGGLAQIVDYDGASVQYSTQIVIALSTGYTATISAVTMAQTLLFGSGLFGASGAADPFNFDDVFRLALNSTTQIGGTCEGAGIDFTQTVGTFVVSTPDISVQRGTMTMGAAVATGDATLTPINVARSFAHVCSNFSPLGGSASSAAANDTYLQHRAAFSFTSPTNLHGLRDSTTNSVTFSFEVATFVDDTGARFMMNAHF